MMCLEPVSGHKTVVVGVGGESGMIYIQRESKEVRNERWKVLNWGYKRYARDWYVFETVVGRVGECVKREREREWGS